MKYVRFRLMAVVVVVAVAPLASAAVLIDGDSAPAGWATSGSSWNSFAPDAGSPTLGWSGLGDAYAYNTSGSSEGAATYTPGATAGFVGGQYDVYAAWAVHPEHNAAVNYTVNYVGGSRSFTVDQRKNAAQGNAGSLSSLSPDTGTGAFWATGSGLLYLGRFNLDGGSSVVASRNGADATTMVADGVMFRAANEGRLIDEQSASVTATNDMPHIYHQPGAPSGNYRLIYQGATTLTWNPEVSSGGLRNVKISWAANPNHNMADYWIDYNGNGTRDSEDTLFTINQSMLADQLTSATSTVWSGWYDLGDLNLTSASRIVETNVPYGIGNVTAAPMLVSSVPEPSAIVTLSTGIISLMAYAWRRRKSSPRGGTV